MPAGSADFTSSVIEPLGALRVRHVQLHARGLIDAVALDVPHHAHDLERLHLRPVQRIGAQALAHRALVGEVEVGERLVDDADGRRALAVAAGECASFAERDGERAEVIGRGANVIDGGDVLRTADDFAFRHHADLIAEAAQRQRMHQPRGLHAGERLDALDELLAERGARGRGGVGGVRNRELQRGHVFGLESRAGVRQAREAREQQARAHQQRGGQGDLRDHQRAARALPRAAAGPGGAALDGLVDIVPAGLPNAAPVRK